MVSADWFPDPDGSGSWRWWDGAEWTAERRPASPFPPAEVLPARCVRCGGTPTAKVEFFQITGWVIFAWFRHTKCSACRDCGIALGRKAVDRSLLLGWIGPVGLGCMILAIPYNVFQLRRLAGLSDATRRSAQPLDPAVTIWRRAGVWVFLAVCVSTGLLLLIFQPAWA